MNLSQTYYYINNRKNIDNDIYSKHDSEIKGTSILSKYFQTEKYKNITKIGLSA